MCALVSNEQQNSDHKVGKTGEEDELEEENPAGPVSRHLYLKPRGGTVDRAEVLRRIRHRKRMNKVKAAAQALFSWPFASNGSPDDNKTRSVPQTRWADDAFAAP